MFSRYARFLLQYRLWVIALALVLTGFMLSELIPPDKIRFDFSFRRLFRFDGEESTHLTKFKDRFGDDASASAVLYVSSQAPSPRPRVLSPSIARSMQRVDRWIRERSEVDQDFTLSPLTATDFFGKQVQPGALALAMENMPDAAQPLSTLDKAWVDDNATLSGQMELYSHAVARFMHHRLYRGMVISEDGSAGAVLYRFNMGHMHPSARKAFLDDLDQLMEKEGEGLAGKARIMGAGIPTVTREYTRLAIQDVIRTAPASILLMAFFLMLLFRSAIGMILPQAVVMIAVIWTLGMMQMTDEPLGLINHIVPVMVLVVGVADAVHILSRYYEERRAGRDRNAAVKRSVEALSKACFLTSATTAVGFASLSTATINTVARFGIYTGIAVMFTYAVNMTLLPIGLSAVGPTPRPQKGAQWLDRFLDWLARLTIARPIEIFAGGLLFAAVSIVVVTLGLGVNSHLLEEVPPDNPIYQATKTMEERLSPVIPHEVLIEGKTTGALCSENSECGAGEVCVKTDRARKAMGPALDSFGKILEPSQMAPLTRLERTLKRALPASSGQCAASVKDPRLLNAIDRAATALMNDPVFRKHVGRVDSLAAIVRQMHLAIKRGVESADCIPDSPEAVSQLLLPLESASQELLDRYTTLYYDSTRISLYLRDHGTNAWDEVRKILEARLDIEITDDPDLSSRFDYQVTGTMTFVDKALSFIVTDMLTSLSTAFIFIFLLMVFLFRSLRIGLLSILPNIFPLLSTLLLMVAADIELRTATIIIFSISLGIAVNDTIHFIARYNEELQGGATRDEAIISSMRFTGRAMLVTTIILASGFLIDLISEFVALQQFGILASFTLVMALLGDLVLLPACLVLFGGPEKS
jgi:uncharacterized protein